MSTYLIILHNAYMEIAYLGERWNSPCHIRRTVPYTIIVWC